ncbi:hypothetical protein Drorol1_Dr00018810 [Drosera rotundifolia]
MSTSSPSITDFLIVLSESKRILNSHSRHFLFLSVLFLLPLSFSFSSFPSLLSSSSSSSTTTTLLNSPPHHHHLRLRQFTLGETLAVIILFAGFALVASVCAIGSITYSVFHGFYDRPVKVGAAVKSLGGSFVRLAATLIAAEVLVGLIVVIFGGIGYLGILGLGFEYGEVGFGCFVGVLGVGLLVVLMYVQVNWGLASVVVVLESKWGFKPLARSRYLIRGMRSVGFALAVFYGGFTGLLVWITVMSGETEFGGGDEEWKSWAFVVQIVVTSSILTLLLLHGIAANTVLYMYCKALHGELAGEVAKDFAAEYVSLPYDDEKVFHDASVAPSC